MPAVPDNISPDSWRIARQPWRACMRIGSAVAALSVAVACGAAIAQTPTQPAAETQTAQAQGQKPPAIPPVTTTVEVHGEVQDNYLPETITAGTLNGSPLRETPLSATIVTGDLLTDQGARLLSDVVKNDASIGEDYAPVGYYGDFQIRGFPIDLATGLERTFDWYAKQRPARVKR